MPQLKELAHPAWSSAPCLGDTEKTGRREQNCGHRLCMRLCLITEMHNRTLCESAANLHGAIPLSVLTGEELVVSFQSVALVTEVLDDSLLGEAVARRWVTAVSPILWFSGGWTNWQENKMLFVLCSLITTCSHVWKVLFSPLFVFKEQS